MKKIVLTGGGTAGHVTPNIALIPELKRKGYEIYYIGSYDGIEKQLIEEQGIKYYGISSGKLRRYKSLKNLSDPFRVLNGIRQANKLMKEIKPDVVFSKGGFVSVPVVLAAHSKKVPVIIHESDMTPGLANKIAIPKAEKVCCNFPETLNNLPKGKAVLTGSPIRKELFEGDKEKGKKILKDNGGYDEIKPVLLVMGGSLGAAAINDSIRKILPTLLDTYQIIHLCGKGKLDESLLNTKGYVQFEYVKDDLKDLLALSDIVVSRAGANAICELLTLKKPTLLIPLSAKASRGDQILNANSFKNLGYSNVLQEEEITNEILLDTINDLLKNKDKYIEKMSKSNQQNSINKITTLIEDCSRRV